MEGTGQAHKEAQPVNDETSNVKEEAHQTSYITTSEIPKLLRKNKTIRLAAAKRTIEMLEKNAENV